MISNLGNIGLQCECGQGNVGKNVDKATENILKSQLKD